MRSVLSEPIPIAVHVQGFFALVKRDHELLQSTGEPIFPEKKRR